MNHPDGDCPLCLFPLVTEDHQSETLPFMKLMSCFHCFHSECIIRWWNWIQSSKETGSANSDNATAHCNRDTHEKLEEGVGNCPVCRKPFHAKDLDHVLDLVGSHSSTVSLNNDEVDNDEKILQSQHEIIRKQRFEAILSLQKENNGLIEPKKGIVILPGMYLQQPVAVPNSTSTKEPDEIEQQERDPPAVGSGRHVGGTSNGPSSSGNRNFGARRHRPRNDHHSSSTARHPRKPVQQQWVRRDNPSNKQ
ncbi:RING finger protein [Medicago truncatula]|uniref:RING finger protein n=1 Tax=Medicago truncatula TaxID=3880 RepID=G7K847_MEDTR|nr:RING finger protein [Medicago truncatula]